MKHAVIVGRFQPFHKGHLEAVKNASEEYEKVAVGVFVSKEIRDNSKVMEPTRFGKENNPFTLEETKEMVESAVRDIRNVTVFEFYSPTLHSEELFRKNLPFPSEETIFLTAIKDEKEKRKVEMMKEYDLKVGEIKITTPYSAEDVRKSLASGDRKWREMVPDAVRDILIKINAEERLKNILFK